MEIDLNERLLYVGGALAAVAVVTGIVFLFVMLRRRKKLAVRLEEEFGNRSGRRAVLQQSV